MVMKGPGLRVSPNSVTFRVPPGLARPLDLFWSLDDRGGMWGLGRLRQDGDRDAGQQGYQRPPETDCHDFLPMIISLACMARVSFPAM